MKNPVSDKKSNQADRHLAGGSFLDLVRSSIVGKYKGRFWVDYRETDGEEARDQYNDLGFRIVRNKQ